MQFSRESKSGSVVRLQFYSDPPHGLLQLQELENLAVERLKALKTVETVGQDLAKGTKEYISHLREKLEKSSELGRILSHTASSMSNSSAAYTDIRRDVVSHFVLRIAYCHSEQLRRWFIQQETDLFRMRFESSDKATMTRFLHDNDIHFEVVDDKEKSRLAEHLSAILHPSQVTSFDQIAYFRVPFTEVLDLVRTRRVVLNGGFAFVPDSELASLVAARFRSHLSHALSVTSRSLPYLEEDTRVLPMLSALSKRYIGEDYGAREVLTDQVRADQVDGLAKTSFPPCMQNLHQSLRRDHHLRHGGRMQYGLFLKGIGLPMEESLKFWRQAFRAKVEPDQFEKRFAYNIRHSYGREGKRTSYTPFSCLKIITTNQPGPGDYNGCPFRHTDPQILRQRLQSIPQLHSDQVDAIVGKAKDRHYQLACRDYFKVVHNIDGASDVAINHPNQYFDESQKHLGAKENHDAGSKGKVVKVAGSKIKREDKSNEEDWDGMDDSELSQIDLNSFSEDT